MRIGRLGSWWLVAVGLMVAGVPGMAQSAEKAPAEAKPAPVVGLEADGTVDVPAESVPLSKFLSPEARAYVNQHLHDMGDSKMTYADKGVPRFMAPYLERMKALFAVNLEDTQIGLVHAYVYTPKEGVSEGNRERVLIQLHGGGFSGCWPGCAELEARPIAALGRIKVVSVDYREAPEFKFPAASEDVARVYTELLKSYKLKASSVTNRVVANCCNSAVFVNFDRGPHWVSAYRARFEGEPQPLEMRIQTTFRVSDQALPEDVPSYKGFGPKLFGRLIGSRLSMMFGR